MGKGFSEACIKTIGACAGAFAGAGIRTGTYVFINHMEAKEVQILQLILEGVSGAISGGFAGYLGAKCAILTQPIISLDELNRLSQIGNLDKKDALNLDKIIDKIKNKHVIPLNDKYKNTSVSLFICHFLYVCLFVCLNV